MIVYRNELSKRFHVEGLVKLHSNLLAGSTGRLVNGIGATCLTLLSTLILLGPHYRPRALFTLGVTLRQFGWFTEALWNFHLLPPDDLQKALQPEYAMKVRQPCSGSLTRY
jgi:hypothetical protein